MLIVLIVLASAFIALVLSVQRKGAAGQDLTLSGVAMAVGGLSGVVFGAAFLLWQLLSVH